MHFRIFNKQRRKQYVQHNSNYKQLRCLLTVLLQVFTPLHPQITNLTAVNRTENVLPQIMILHALGHNYNSKSSDSEILVHAHKNILLKQKKMGETRTKLQTS
jgi:hypothetical protein